MTRFTLPSSSPSFLPVPVVSHSLTFSEMLYRMAYEQALKDLRERRLWIIDIAAKRGTN